MGASRLSWQQNWSPKGGQLAARKKQVTPTFGGTWWGSCVPWWSAHVPVDTSNCIRQVSVRDATKKLIRSCIQLWDAWFIKAGLGPRAAQGAFCCAHLRSETQVENDRQNLPRLRRRPGGFQLYIEVRCRSHRGSNGKWRNIRKTSCFLQFWCKACENHCVF